MAYKPETYNDLSPYLIVDGAEGLIAFLEKALDGKATRVFKADDRIVHAEVMLGDSVLMLADGSEQYPAIKSVLHLYVPDVEAVFQRALDAGAVSVQAPQVSEGDPDRRGTFSDPFGNLWSLGTQLAEA